MKLSDYKKATKNIEKGDQLPWQYQPMIVKVMSVFLWSFFAVVILIAVTHE